MKNDLREYLIAFFFLNFLAFVAIKQWWRDAVVGFLKGFAKGVEKNKIK